MDEFLFLIAGVLLGFLTGWALAKVRLGRVITQDPENVNLLETSILTLQAERDQIHKELALLQGRLEKSIEVYNEQKAELAEKESRINTFTGQLQRVEAEKESIHRQLNEQAAEIEKLNERFRLEFQNVANEILKQNSKDFSESNRRQIGEILNPLREKIEGFEKRVNDVHTSESQQRSELLGQVKSLMELSKQVSAEAGNLSKALRGDTKTQGSWGELILEKILENSGLERGVEYEVQESSRTEDGLYRPDVVVKLPDNKVIVIDSKVSLTAYDSYVNSANSEDRSRALQQHISSLRNHVRLLTQKNYQSNVAGDSLDFVLMFVPIESGFIEALKNDRDIYNYAWDARIVIVSPTTLLATLRTVAMVWKQDKQNRNVMEIARVAGSMYDKFCGFVDDLLRIEEQLKKTQVTLDTAMGKLHTGRGNLVRSAETVRELGAKTSKQLRIQGDDIEADED